ncbi:MAG: LpqB family beta-propeller domain-containing protein [Buchananella hordeovulneris]|nr:LpqB family beta-propeller domain-containing protein [Buchananella hordeovulneris]
MENSSFAEAGRGRKRAAGRRRRALSVLLAAAVLAGCTAYPQAGPVQAANPDLPDSAQVAQTASGPVKDAPPSEIVAGFLRASAAGLDDDFGTARRFLTQDAAVFWDPAKSALIYPSDSSLNLQTVTAGGQVDAVKLETPVTGTLSRNGQFTATEPGSRSTLQFKMAKDEAGQWRISDLDDGVLISSASFSLSYNARNLTFLTTDRKAAVPDLRYLPRRRLATHVVNALLAGPAPWLEGAVASTVPAGAQLDGAGVELTDGVAEVELTTEARMSVAERALLRAQVEGSLAGIPQVQSVRTVLNGEVITEASAVLEPRPGGAPLLIVSSERRLLQRVGDSWRIVEGPSEVSVDPRHPTYLGGHFVFIDGNELKVMDSREARVLAVDDLTRPSADRLEWVWSQLRGPNLTAVRKDGKSTTIAVPWLSQSQVLQLLVSRDGARLVVVRKQDGIVRLEVAGIRRDAEGIPTGLSEPSYLAEVADSFYQATWENDVQLLVLHGRDGVSLLERLPLGGVRSSQRVQDGALQVAANPSDGTVVVVNKEGELYQLRGGVWRLTSSGVTDPSFGN